MSIQLIDFPATLLRTDEEVQTGKVCRFLTHTAAAQMCNYLNFYARRVVPWCNWPSGSSASAVKDIESYQFVAPLDGDDYTQRTLSCVYRLARVGSESDDLGQTTLTVTSSTGGSTAKIIFSNNITGNWGSYDYEHDMVYVYLEVDVTGSRRELITATLSTDMSGVDWAIMGGGAWELPPKADGTLARGAWGVAQGKAAVPAGTTDGVEHWDYYVGSPVDTDLEKINRSSIPAFNNHRRMVWNIGAHDATTGGYSMRLHTAVQDGTWTSVTEQGLYIPAYCSRTGDTTRNMRAAVYCKTDAGYSDSQWRVSSSSCNSTGKSVTWSSPQWSPFWTGAAFDETEDGESFTVGLTGEFIDVQVMNSSGCDNVVIYQIEIWEDIYDADEA